MTHVKFAIVVFALVLSSTVVFAESDARDEGDVKAPVACRGEAIDLTPEASDRVRETIANAVSLTLVEERDEVTPDGLRIRERTWSAEGPDGFANLVGHKCVLSCKNCSSFSGCSVQTNGCSSFTCNGDENCIGACYKLSGQIQ